LIVLAIAIGDKSLPRRWDGEKNHREENEDADDGNDNHNCERRGWRQTGRDRFFPGKALPDCTLVGQTEQTDQQIG